MWCPDLNAAAGPIYRALADAIAGAIEQRTLEPGAQLPTQRELAAALGVTVGTITRSYAEAARRGLVSGEVGRGTFVRGPRSDPGTLLLPHTDEAEVLNLAHNLPHCGDLREIVPLQLQTWARAATHDALGYSPHAGTPRARAAGARWLQRAGVETAADQVLVTCGAQHAIVVALATVTEPGDLVLAEAVTYSGIKSACRLLRLRLEGVAVDDGGVRSGAFADACRRAAPKAIYLTPTLQNPTGTVLGLERRQAIAAIARQYDVSVIEDDTYAFLLETAPPPIAAFAPERTFFLTSLSKCLMPGLRIGFLRQPAAIDDASAAIMATTLSASPMAADFAATLIENGTAERIAGGRRREAHERQAMARALLGEHMAPGIHDHSAHAWLMLPEPWRGDEFAAAARARGVAVAPADTFTVARAAVPHAVRISLSAVRDTARLQQGLAVLAELLRVRKAPPFAGV